MIYPKNEIEEKNCVFHTHIDVIYVSKSSSAASILPIHSPKTK